MVPNPVSGIGKQTNKKPTKSWEETEKKQQSNHTHDTYTHQPTLSLHDADADLRVNQRLIVKNFVAIFNSSTQLSA